MRRSTCLLLALALAACGGDDDDGSPSPTDPIVVSVENNLFLPDSLDVDAGETVTFVWGAGSVNHNVTPWAQNDAETPASPDLPALYDAPFAFDVTFGDTGDYRFYCQPHGNVGDAGELQGMAGVIRVR